MTDSETRRPLARWLNWPNRSLGTYLFLLGLAYMLVVFGWLAFIR